MKKLVCAALVVGLGMTGSIWAAEGEAAAKKAGCLSCHTVAKKVVGPAFKDVAVKYAGNADAQAKLEAKVRSGGAGSFGGMAMPPTNKGVSDADIKTIVGWILGLK